MAFPSLSVNPEYPIEEQRVEDGIKTTADKGYVHGRFKFTRARKIFWPNYPNLPSADKTLIDNHLATVGTVIAFDWTNADPDDGNTYSMRYIEYPVFRLIAPGIWETRFGLQGYVKS